ncbi:unnamed protein product [Gongylonema pulchrum]|uniref:ATPase_AAA_core domain-containing protein n=1 Tax=Gongylonema pulchrum TaxID=637853 RepID=A0A183DVG5_9BILA|nr:unnamed protein product [Gongylonema pulchrum]
MARGSMLHRNEPTDGVRAVNAVLTEVDRIRRHSNVESLTMARGSMLHRNEPTDGVRAVNAVLTEVDRIRRHSNVFILATSNIMHSLDEAFTDRADLSRFVGYPSAEAIYTIFLSCIDEMLRQCNAKNAY